RPRELRAGVGRFDVVNEAVAALRIEIADAEDVVAVSTWRERKDGLLAVAVIADRQHGALGVHHFNDGVHAGVEQRAETAGFHFEPERLALLPLENEVIQIAVLVDAALDSL